MPKPPLRDKVMKKKVCTFCKEKNTQIDYKTRHCCVSTSATAARSAPAASPATASSTSGHRGCREELA